MTAFSDETELRQRQLGETFSDHCECFIESHQGSIASAGHSEFKQREMGPFLTPLELEKWLPLCKVVPSRPAGRLGCAGTEDVNMPPGTLP